MTWHQVFPLSILHIVLVCVHFASIINFLDLLLVLHEQFLALQVFLFFLCLPIPPFLKKIKENHPLHQDLSWLSPFDVLNEALRALGKVQLKRLKKHG